MRSKELKVGIFMAVALVLLYYGFNFLKGTDFFSSNAKYYTIFDNVDQLSVSNPVLVSGYAVGRVSNIRILTGNSHRVLVEMEIESSITVGDSTVAILNSDFLGNKSILLQVGAFRVPFEPGDTIRSEVAKGLTDILTETAQPVANNLESTIRKFNEILNRLAENTDDINAIIAGLKQTPGKLNSTLDKAGAGMDEFSAEMKQVSQRLTETLDRTRPLIANLTTLSDSLKRVELNATLEKTQAALVSLNETMARFKSGDNTVSRLMTEDSLYVNLNRLLVSLDSLANHLNQNPKHFMAPLGKSRKRIEKDLREQKEDDK
jgi:phospholipid/cholesterol/gamma-HCH transport system substrate-binding protein